MNLIERLKLRQVIKKFEKKVNEKERDYLLSAIKEGQTVLDVGAHVGAFSYFMRQGVGDTGKVYAFEPQSMPYQLLLQHTQRLHWNNVAVLNLALSDSKGTVKLHIPSNKGRADTEGATILAHSDRSLYTTETVSTETLDNFCKEHGLAPSFLKIDVEGNELKVLQGGIETIKSNSPKVFVEIEARHCGKEQGYKTFQFLTGLGYKGWFILKNELVPLQQFDFDVYQVKKKRPYCNNFIFEK
jgi:FkbM family methyltransferase